MMNKVLDYFKKDELASGVWLGKYAQDGEETPDDMHLRIAKELGRAIHNRLKKSKFKKSDVLSTFGQSFFKMLKEMSREEIVDWVYGYLKDFKYIIPQGSIMSQLGSKSIGSLSNCFVIGQPENSYGGIFQKDEEMVQLMKRRGGVGIDISTLAPCDTPVSNAAKTTTGAVSFMHRYSNSTREVAQNGRRGALMLSIHINHPDVLDFIKIKRDLSQVTGANISVKISEEFMKAVEADADFVLRFPCDADAEIAYPDPNSLEYGKLYTVDSNKKNPVQYIKRIKAKEYWDEIIKSAHGFAEPGIIFVDNHHNYSPDGVYSQYKGVTTNPCGEIFMQPYDACRLIATNLLSMVRSAFTSDSEFDLEKFYEVEFVAMFLSDIIVDLELENIDRILEKIRSDKESHEVRSREYKLWKKVRDTALSSRRTGLGFTALGDCIAALGMKYDSDESLLFVEGIMYNAMESQLDCTIDMAVLNGPFDGWDDKKEYDTHTEDGLNSFYRFIGDNFNDQVIRMSKYGRRNVSWNTVAPTGTVSLLTQTTSGLEPIFQPFYTRRKKVNPGSDTRVDFTDQNGDTWQEFPVLHEQFKNWITSLYNEDNPLWWECYMLDMTKLVPVKDFPIVPVDKNILQIFFEKSPWYGSTANDIDWNKRVEMQAIIQKYTTHSISSTINLPNTVTEAEVSEIYLHSWKMGLKGVTVYRDGSRSGVLVSDDKPKLVTFNENHAPKRPKSLPCKIVRFNNNYEKWIAFVGMMDNKPYEVFTGKADTVDLPTSIEVGEIKKIKDGNKRYDFVYDGGVIEDISKVSSENYWNYGKLISGMLRHGMPLQFVVDTIQNLTWDNDHINTWKNGIARSLKKFIKDGKVEGIKCQDCSSENIIFEEGCSKCLDCGSSKCG